MRVEVCRPVINSMRRVAVSATGILAIRGVSEGRNGRRIVLLGYEANDV